MEEAIRILVVDDEAESAAMLKTFLERGGFETKVIHDPTRTLDELKKKQYQLVVLDMFMPQMPGTEVLRLIREFDDDLAVIVATGYPSVNNAVESLQLSANDYVKKPVEPDAFIETVRGVLQKKGIAPDAESALNQAVGRIIRDLRKKQRLTLEQLAKRSGLSVSAISQFERAESSPSVSSLYKIASAFGINVRDLFPKKN
ncbi:MAG: response regulator [Myxococcaceae bacterium]